MVRTRELELLRLDAEKLIGTHFDGIGERVTGDRSWRWSPLREKWFSVKERGESGLTVRERRGSEKKGMRVRGRSKWNSRREVEFVK
jgi:hypothetical protein